MNHPKITAAHKTVRTDFHGRLPVYYGASGEDRIVELPDGSHAYELESAGEWLLWRSASAVDAGDNACEIRAAPASLAGICEPPLGRPPHTLIGDGEPIGVLRRHPAPVGRPPVAEQTSRVSTSVPAEQAAAAAASEGGQSATLRRALARHLVITWGDTRGGEYDCCPACEAAHQAADDWPAPYCQVQHGLREGLCQSPHHDGTHIVPHPEQPRSGRGVRQISPELEVVLAGTSELEVVRAALACRGRAPTQRRHRQAARRALEAVGADRALWPEWLVVQ